MDLKALLFHEMAGKVTLSLSSWVRRYQLSQEEGYQLFSQLAKETSFLLFDGQDTLVRLTPYEPLNSHDINAGFKVENLPCTLHYHFSLPSTNQALEKIEMASLPQVVIAEQQTAGYGRQGSRWLSPLGQHLYYSFYCKFPIDLRQKLSSLSLEVGMVLIDLLASLGVKAKLKWPNDLWVKGRKLAGILVETVVKKEILYVTIGIGINNHKPLPPSLSSPTFLTGSSTRVSPHSPLHASKEASQPAYQPISCEEVGGTPLNRNLLVVKLTSVLYQLCREFEAVGDLPYKKTIPLSHGLVSDITHRWPYYSYCYQQSVTVIINGKHKKGVECGITLEGALIVEHSSNSGKCQVSYYSGELSLRPDPSLGPNPNPSQSLESL